MQLIIKQIEFVIDCRPDQVEPIKQYLCDKYNFSHEFTHQVNADLFRVKFNYNTGGRGLYKLMNKVIGKINYMNRSDEHDTRRQEDRDTVQPTPPMGYHNDIADAVTYAREAAATFHF